LNERLTSRANWSLGQRLPSPLGLGWSIYCRRRFVGGTQYEIWARLSGERTEFIVNTWSSKGSADKIRHFLATTLNINEDLNYSNSLL
jgi:hypothetical protein